MRTIEATQFSVGEFLDTVKNGTVHKNPFKNKGMELLKQQNLDPKSELNTRLGGLDNIQRIRVMKDLDNESNLLLTFNLKSPEKELQRLRQETERKREAESLKAFPLFIPDARGFVVEALRSALSIQQKVGVVLPVDLVDVIAVSMSGWGEEAILKDIRGDVNKLIIMGNDVLELRAEPLFNHYMGLAFNMLNIYIMEYMRSSRDLLELAAHLWRANSSKSLQGDKQKRQHKPQKPRPQPKVEKKDQTTIRS